MQVTSKIEAYVEQKQASEAKQAAESKEAAEAKQAVEAKQVAEAKQTTEAMKSVEAEQDDSDGRIMPFMTWMVSMLKELPKKKLVPVMRKVAEVVFDEFEDKR